MTKQKKNVALVALGTAAMLGLCACEEQPAQPQQESAAVAEQATPKTPEQAPAATEARDALMECLVYDLGKHASELAGHPELNASVRNMLALMEDYYTQISEAKAGTPEKLRLALHMADTTRNLTAWERAAASYDRALADYEAMPEAEREKPDNKRMLSAIYNGKAFCRMNTQQLNEALDLYNRSLAVDSAAYERIAPSEGEALPEGEVEPTLARAAEDLFFSYRCLGECQEAAGDPEEARETLRLGLELAKRLDRLSPGMSLQYIRLLGAMGNLESRCGNEREALNHWTQAATICQRLHETTADAAIRFKVSNQFRNLLPQIQDLQKKLNPEQNQ